MLKGHFAHRRRNISSSIKWTDGREATSLAASKRLRNLGLHSLLNRLASFFARFFMTQNRSLGQHDLKTRAANASRAAGTTSCFRRAAAART
mmetsp:Transcript_82231/g.172157  ORF Transcript_82231/g.172157 Transcript_82231/m.172157 type:complete len:92 (+) Transcript_82231:646-921(+)